MLAPMYSNCGELKTFRQGPEGTEMIEMRYFFVEPMGPPGTPHKSFAPPIPYLPVATIVMPRGAFRDLLKKSNLFLASQEEMKGNLGPIEGGPHEITK